MSFGEGNLHIQVAQLKTENARMKQQLEKLRTLNGELCAEVNAKDMRIYDLEAIIRNMYSAWVGWEQRDDIRREIEDAIQGIVKVIQ